MQSISLAIYERILWARTMVENRLERTDEGQTAIEYVGLLLLVAGVIAALYQAGIIGWAGESVGSFVTDVIEAGPQ